MSVFLELINLIKLRIGNMAVSKDFLTSSYAFSLRSAMLYGCIYIVHMYIVYMHANPVQIHQFYGKLNSDEQEQTKQYTHCDWTTPY